MKSESGPRATPAPSRFAPGDRADDAGLYVHVPFCSVVCPYCDFAVARMEEGDGERYVEALLREVRGWSAPGVVFTTVYLGGGTPSALTPDQLGRVVEAVRARFQVSPDCEWTLEVNPEDVDAAAATSWRELGFERASVGLQSFDDHELRFLGRRHTAREGVRALAVLRESGPPLLSVDLIYGLAGSEPGRWRERAAALDGFEHVSCYELTVHEGTPFARLAARGKRLQAPEAEKLVWFQTVQDTLGELGLAQYEVSNFARSPELESRHNRKYWRGVPYLGLGPSAHSFDGARRWSLLRSWRAWRAALVEGRSAVAMQETLTDAERLTEELMLGLRTVRGVDLDQLRARYGVDLRSARASALTRLLEEEWVVLEATRLRPTAAGLAVADRLALDLV